MRPTSVGPGLSISADCPGVFTKLMTGRQGTDMLAVIANGSRGNINHGDYITGKCRSTLELAAAAWPGLKPTNTFAPRVRSERVALQHRRFGNADIAKAKDIAGRILTGSLA